MSTFPFSVAGFAHWKEILLLAMGCEEAAVGDLHEFFVAMLCVLRSQLSTGMVGLTPNYTSCSFGTDANLSV